VDINAQPTASDSSTSHFFFMLGACSTFVRLLKLSFAPLDRPPPWLLPTMKQKPSQR
jgi:hypothetical protein